LHHLQYAAFVTHCCTVVLPHCCTAVLLLLQYRNPWGFLRIGRLLEDLDSLAGSIAFTHW
jgi:hypothetical protein